QRVTDLQRNDPGDRHGGDCCPAATLLMSRADTCGLPPNSHTGGSRMRKEKRVPLSEVSTFSALAMASRSVREIASPRPALEKRMPTEPGRKPSNSMARTFSGMPRPVSWTQNSTHCSSISVQPMETEPESVYRSAFVVRLSRTRLIADG